MKRFSECLAVLLVLVATAYAPAQSPPSQTLVERLGGLRADWTSDSDAQKQPVHVAQNTGDRAAALASDSPTPFPRVNPRELLPRNWFGAAGEAAPAASTPAEPAPTQDVTPTPGGAAGSARARLLRDVRRAELATSSPTSEPAGLDTSRQATPRAGSALSPGAPRVALSPATRSAQSSRLARSIAAEAANAIDDSAAGSRRSARVQAANQPAVDGPALTAVSPTPVVDDSVTPVYDEPSVAVEGVPPTEEDTYTASESTLPFGETTYNDAVEDKYAAEPSEAPTPTLVASAAPTPVTPEPVTPAVEPTPPHAQVPEAADSVAETDSGRISVAARPTETTTLPLFIGDRYSTLEESKDASAQPSAASSAFATGPSAKSSSAAKPTPAPATPEDDLLLTQRMPVLVSKVSGPRTIIVGREVTYRVLLANRGDVGADRVETRVTVPEWAEVMSFEAPEGTVERNDTLAEAGTLIWRTKRLAAGAVTKLDLRLIARSGKPIELGVVHRHDPIDSRTLVEVQEPKLRLDLVGPEEVLYGKPQLFRLTIANPGTGLAENVVLHLTPPGGDADRRTSHDFGQIEAGAERTVEIELTAREAGELAVNASANADGGVTADTTKEIFCRKPELVVDWRGPADRYAGAPALYYFRVRNPGTAIAPDVVLDVELPAGFEVLAGAETPAANNGRLSFKVGSLRPGDDRYFELRGVLRKAGANEIVLRAAGSDETRSEHVTAQTEVVALADLKLDVHDPKGPVATGQEIAYEIRVTNRGLNDAHDVRVLGLFSEGIEPHHVEGGESQTRDGRVAFETIERLPAGEQRVFTIHARAHEEGTHLFRAEVLCRDLEIKLAAEETTRFFEDEAINIAGDGYPSGPTNPTFPR